MALRCSRRQKGLVTFLRSNYGPIFLHIPMDGQGRQWVIFVGINFYVEDKCLEGCVRDVENANSFFGDSKSTLADVTILTASNPGASGVTVPTENEARWPTSERFTSSLMRIIKECKQGDHVYIHYSGHGTRIKNSDGNLELALVLFEDNEHHRSYFRGQHLATALQVMVHRGLHITLILDCCFAGSMKRDEVDIEPEESVRFAKYDPNADDQPANPFAALGVSEYRDSRMVRDWIIDPQGYAVLCACGPNQIARELKFENTGHRAGALSYFLLEALYRLRETGASLTLQSLYDHIRTRFLVEWPEQVPMRYGDPETTFFGDIVVSRQGMEFLPIAKIDGRLYLGAGHAHGVRKGDEYEVRSLEASQTKDIREECRVIRVRIEMVWPLQAEVIAVDPSFLLKDVDTGWKAKLLTRLDPGKVLVGLKDSLPEKDTLITLLINKPFVRTSITSARFDTPNVLNVESDPHGEYAILDGSMNKIEGLPQVNLNEPGASKILADLLDHLSRFTYLKGLQNRIPNLEFERSYSVVTATSPGPDGIHEIMDGNDWVLEVTNLGKDSLYLAIFDFTPEWGITNLTTDCGRGNFIEILPCDETGEEGHESVEITMECPANLRAEGQTHCQDVIKVVFSSEPTSFPGAILPKLTTQSPGQSTSSRGTSRDDMLDFLSSITSAHRTGFKPSEHQWMTHTFIVRTTVQSFID